jgi:hypothetical protein
MGDDRVGDAMLRAVAYYREKGEVGLREQIRRELRAAREHLETYIGRNRLVKQ